MPEGKAGREAMADFRTTWRAPGALLAAIILLGSMAASMVAGPAGGAEAGDLLEVLEAWLLAARSRRAELSAARR